MTKEEITEMMNDMERYVNTANADEVMGRMFRLGIAIEKDDHVTESAMELALIVALLEEKKDDT